MKLTRKDIITLERYAKADRMHDDWLTLCQMALSSLEDDKVPRDGWVPVSAILEAPIFLKALRNNPWPTSNPIWKIMEGWLVQLCRLAAGREE